MAEFSLIVGDVKTLTVIFKDGGGGTVALHSPAQWTCSDQSVIALTPSGTNTAQLSALKSNPDGTAASVTITATAPASPFNTAFTGNTSADVSPVIITITSAAFTIT